MRSGTCPKCQSTEVYYCPAQGGLSTGIKADGALLFNIHTEKPGLFGSSFQLLYLEYYVCQGCGYLEHYVNDLQALESLPGSVNWQKHSPTN